MQIRKKWLNQLQNIIKNIIWHVFAGEFHQVVKWTKKSKKKSKNVINQAPDPSGLKKVRDRPLRLPDELSPGEARIPIVFVVMLYPLVQVDLLRPKGCTPGGEELRFLVFSYS
jgi:hypothetical protein